MNIGHTTEAQFIVKALQQGWEIAVPFGGGHSYDFLVRRAVTEGWKMVQVKKGYIGHRGNVIEVGLRRSKGGGSGMQPYKQGDFDFLFVWHDGNCWLVPWKIVEGRTSCVQIGRKQYDEWKI